MAKRESKLEEIYALVEYSKKTGIELTDEQLRQISEREEQYIKEDVLPVLRNSIEPILQKIQRELTLVVNYHPNEPITLRISHDPNLSDLDGAVPLTPDDIPGLKKRNKQQRGANKVPTQVLKVTMPDGSVIYNEKNGTDTFCKVIERLGLMRVRNLNIMLSGVNLVSTTKDPNRQQHKVDGLYIFTNRSTTDKKKILDQIAVALNQNITVEVVNKLID